MRQILFALKAARAYSFPASSVGVVVGAACAVAGGRWSDLPVGWLVATWLAATLLHAGCNLVNDYYDAKNEVDDGHMLRSSRVAGGGEAILERVHMGGLLCLGLGSSIGLYVAFERSYAIYGIGAVGLAIAYFYTAKPLGLKYRALGEPAVFLAMGPLMVLGSYLAVRGAWTAEIPLVLLISLPIGLMVTAILYANNLRDSRNDAAKGFVTLPIVLRPRWAARTYYAIVSLAYAVPLVLCATTSNPWWLLPLGSLPLEVMIVWRIAVGFPSRLERLRHVDVACVHAHLLYGMLLAAAILLATPTQST